MVIGTCILCLWDIQLTFDSYNMGHFKSYVQYDKEHGDLAQLAANVVSASKTSLPNKINDNVVENWN